MLYPGVFEIFDPLGPYAHTDRHNGRQTDRKKDTRLMWFYIIFSCFMKSIALNIQLDLQRKSVTLSSRKNDVQWQLVADGHRVYNGYTSLIFLDPGLKADGVYNRSQQLLGHYRIHLRRIFVWRGKDERHSFLLSLGKWFVASAVFGCWYFGQQGVGLS